MLWQSCVYVSNIKSMRLNEPCLGIVMYFYANLPLVAPILLLYLWLLRTLAVQGLFSTCRTYYYYVFVIVDDDYKILSFPISQTVGWFAILLL